MILPAILILSLITSLLSFFSRRKDLARWIALWGSFGVFIATLLAVFWPSFQGSAFDVPLSENQGIRFSLAMDGLSALLVLLTTFLTPIIILTAFNKTYRRRQVFFGLITLMEFALIGVFMARDGLLFYIFWELALIPAYFIAGLWGSTDKIRITFKFFVYTLLGSLFMLLALILLYIKTPAPHSFNLEALYAVPTDGVMQNWLFACFFIAFAIKIPIFPFHTWQPDTYTTAPYQGTMLLSGIMLKMGIYGILRFLIPLCPLALADWGWIAVLLSVTGIVYASLIALRQHDLKRLLAYASMAHVGLIAAGALCMNDLGLRGATLQMLAHGINVVGLFALVEMIQIRFKTRKILELGGIAAQAPVMAVFFVLMILGTVALPLTAGFVGEFLLLAGVFAFNPWLAGFAGLSIVFTAVYLLKMNKQVMFGPLNPSLGPIRDLTAREIIVMAPLALMTFWLGLFPSTFLDLAGPALRQILAN